SPAHNGQVCSTWGNFHYKTFDGDIFQLHSTCNYILTSSCHSTYNDFNIQIRRQEAGGSSTIKNIILNLQGSVVELSKGSVTIDAILPVSRAGVLIEKTSTYIKIKAKLGLVAFWNEEDSFLVELDQKFKNQTCGLCGDFNGVQLHDEFYSHGVKLSLRDFADFWKMNGPTEACSDYTVEPTKSCDNLKPVCEQILMGPAFSSCHNLLDITSFTSACVADLCHCASSEGEKADPLCLCNTVSEFSRQCVHAGGKPQNWRTEELCWKSCQYQMEYKECGSPCADTCSNPDASLTCDSHCMDGCFCPAGTVFDDLNRRGCVPLSECSCSYNSKTYGPGESYSSNCKKCGQWECQEEDCPGTCSVEGGAHIKSFDGKFYTFHGDCSYVLAKDCSGTQFVIQGELVQCGMTESETCLKSVTLGLSGGANVSVIHKKSPTHNTVYLRFLTWKKSRNCLCGNFNSNQADDFLKLSGVTDATAAGFANSWKTHAGCPDVKSSFKNPCSLSVDNENYAQHWCSMLTDPQGVFASCHSEISPDSYKEASNCMYDSCNCEKSEDFMCAAVSSYIHACAAAGIQISDWRKVICGKYASSCPSGMVYSYNITSSSRTCRCIGSTDLSCHSFPPIDGCICAEGTYMDDSGKCVPSEACPCYNEGSAVPAGQVINKEGTCLFLTACAPPMVFFNCSANGPAAKGTECEKSCSTLDMACVSTGCVSGCMCASGLVSDGNGGCIEPGNCSCVHNGISYQPGETTKVDCNTCTCNGRTWQCTTNQCDGTCYVYGDGHYMTFDQNRFTFDGSCEYILTQDYCGSAQSNGTFRVITENVPCGTTGTTCSKTIKIFLRNAELILTDGSYQLLSSGAAEAAPFQYSTMGNYLVVEANNGLILMWDKKTTLFIKLSPKYKGHVCGLCGNYDGSANNDLTTRSNAVVVNPLVFGNSWKDLSSCPNAQNITSPCTSNPYRQSWAQKQCSIIQSDVFSACHSSVDPVPYYDACVFDSCACDTGGDCECFCTAVAAYAESCNQAGVCVQWRTPNICPVFCDYYNPPDECEWHYMPCGSPCMKTCRNPSSNCSTQIPPLEGCYPKCPPAVPYFDEDTMTCVSKEQCGCYNTEGIHYNNGDKVPYWIMDISPFLTACICTYNGKKYPTGSTLDNMTDGNGNCITAVCGINGTIIKLPYSCTTTTVKFKCCGCPTPTTSTTTVTTLTSFPTSTTVSTTTQTTVTKSPTTTTPPTTTETPCQETSCYWSEWINADYPEYGPLGGDNETIKYIIKKGYDICDNPIEVECQAVHYPGMPLDKLGQKVTCNNQVGLLCENSLQHPPICLNYEIKVKCCKTKQCSTTNEHTTTALKHITTTQATPTTTTTQLPTTTPPTTTATTTTPTTTPTEPVTTTSTTTTPTTTTTQPPSTTATTTRPTTTMTAQPTTICPGGHDVVCDWSNWINLGSPTPGPDGGQNDTIQNIISAGYHICSSPEEVQCRAALYPELSMSQLGQAVTCNKDVGLICINKQQGLNQECFDYEIKFKCCGCPRTSSTTVTTTTHVPTTTPTTTTPTTTETTSTTQPPTTTPTTTTPTTTETKSTTHLPTPGPDGGQNDTIQNIISAGYRICSSPEEVQFQCRAVLYPELSMSQVGQAVICNKDVGLVCINKQQGLQQKCFDYEIRFKCCGCPTTHVPTTTPTTTTPSTTETTTTTHLPSTTTAISSTNPATTSELNPVTGGTSTPDGESWMVSNCTTGTCTNGTVNYTNTPCPPLKPVVCANNFPAIKVTDPNDCCPHYECQCICYGWGDPHYVTFDGTYYGFQGNCSYWLVKEILPKYNFNVMINNSYCGAADGLSCPQSITVFYDSFKIFITQKDINGIFTNQVLVNNKPINPAYQYGDFRVTTTGIDTVLVIGAIQAKITFSGLIFSIYLPYNLFAGNTEGQCGTCDNNRTDDCRLPDGKIDPSCPNMARQWHTNDSSCDQPSPPPTTPAPDTCNATLCNIIKSSVFEACHNIINYNPFVTGCEFDMCHSRISRTGCTSLQAYADACAEAGVCIEWRNATKGLCGMQLRHTLISFCAELLTLYIQVGDLVPMKPCEKCICSNQTDASSHLHIVECYSIPCDTNCPLVRPSLFPPTCFFFQFTYCFLSFIPSFTLSPFLSYSAEMSSLQHTCSCCQELATSERQIQLSCPDNTEVTYTYTHIDACGCLKTECSAPGNGAMTSPEKTELTYPLVTCKKHGFLGPFHFFSLFI
uniref:Uncharacterized protein n=1 Tax=Amphiprion ocellaris TaxID=80972 RepID=A0AAQ5YCF1_AMPOC